VIANDEKKLEVLEARRTALHQELDRVGEEMTQVRAELDKAKSLL
jgi:prefoldin subunit 5